MPCHKVLPEDIESEIDRLEAEIEEEKNTYPTHTEDNNNVSQLYKHKTNHAKL